jgi:hypothetical protein
MKTYGRTFQLNGFYDDYIAPFIGGAKSELKNQLPAVGKQVVVKYLDKSGALKQVTTTVGSNGQPIMPTDYKETVSRKTPTDYTPYVIAGSVGLIALVAILKKR